MIDIPFHTRGAFDHNSITDINNLRHLAPVNAGNIMNMNTLTTLAAGAMLGSMASGGMGGPGFNNQYGNGQYQNPQFGNAQVPNDPYGQAQYGNSQYGNNQYGNNQYGNNQYGNNQYGNNQYGNNQYGNNQYGGVQQGNSGQFGSGVQQGNSGQFGSGVQQGNSGQFGSGVQQGNSGSFSAYGQQASSGQYGQSAPGSYSRQSAPNPGAMQNTGFPYQGNAQPGGNGQYQGNMQNGGNIPYQGNMQAGNNAPYPGNMPAGAGGPNQRNMPSAGNTPAPAARPAGNAASQAAPAPAGSVPLPPPPERPPLAVDKPVRKGQKVTLSMQPLKSITAYLDWNVKDGRCDIDVSAFLLGENGKVPGDDWFVFYGQPESPDASVSFNDRARIGRQSVHIDFSKVSTKVKKVTFVLTINEAAEQNLNFSMVKDACIKIVEDATDNELASFRMDEYYDNVISMMIGEVYAYKDNWKFNAIGNGVARDLGGLCELYGVQVSD